MGLHFVPFPGPCHSGDQVFGECSRCYLLPVPSLPLSFLFLQLVRLLRRMLIIQNPKKSWLAMKPACSLMPLWGHDCPLLDLAALAPLSFAQDGLICRWLALLSPLFCRQAWWCLSLGLFAGLAIPGSGLLCQVSSLRLPSGHSGPVLTLSNAACTSFPSPRLLVVDASVCTASPLGVAIRHVICGV